MDNLGNSVGVVLLMKSFGCYVNFFGLFLKLQPWIENLQQVINS